MLELPVFGRAMSAPCRKRRRRLRDASPSEVISMWERGTNENGQKLNHFEFAALRERWIEVFRVLPPDTPAGNSAADLPKQPALEPLMPDALVDIKEVRRRTGISESTIKRMVLDGRFPKPMSPRRV